MKFSAFFFRKEKYIKRQNILNLLSQLHTLFSAGVSLTKCLHILKQTCSNPLRTVMLVPIIKELEAGHSLHVCLNKFPQYFDILSCRLIQLGEKAGRLDTMLMRVITYQQKSIKIHKQIIRALLYPAIVLATTLSTLLFMLIFIVPRFAILFEQFPQKLPLATRSIIFISRIMPQITVILVISTLYIICAVIYLKKNNTVTSVLKRISYYLPIIGKIQSKILLLRFTHYLSTALSAGIPLTEALTMTSFLFSDTKVPNVISQIRSSVSAGNSLHRIFTNFSFFPPLLIQLVKTGEESGMLEQMLEKFSGTYETEVEESISFLHQILEPFIICVLGIIIGAITLAMYLPIFKLGSVL